jgi:hypothetical protein
MNANWKEGDKVPYFDGGAHEPARAGLFFYSGFTMGNYFAADGRIMWLSSTEAEAQAKADGVSFVFRDCFDHYSATSVAN